MSVPVALWPDGFREKRQAEADAIVARDSAPTPLEMVTAAFPGALEAAVKGLGLAHVPEWVIVAGVQALAACVISVQMRTAGTVTVVDRRTPEA
jgi:hypothetical protein